MILKHPKAPLVFGILIIIGLVTYVTLYRSSPGELSRPHAAIAGSSFITDCNKCHAQKDVTPGCLSCHTEIGAQLQQKRGFHPFLLKDKKLECAHCHSEHNGPDFALVSKVSWEGKDVRAFTHPHVVFRLKGAHTKLSCEKCHEGKIRPSFSLPKFPKYPRAHSYLGLSQFCISCHADPHAGGKASACASCHNQDHWKPAPFFGHDKFFPLNGVHARVSCSQCHAPARKDFAPNAPLKIFGPVKGTRCTDCHSNPHRVDWRRACESCHGVQVPWSAARTKFTKELHNITGFRLVTPHATVSCQSCHASGRIFAERYPAPPRRENRCESCHQDPHRAQFTSAHPHCIDCHGLRAFKPSTFSAKDHKIYLLIGGHTTASCNLCHTKEARSGIRKYIGTPRDCAACHRDMHYGQFRNDNGKTRCEICHQSVGRWSKVIFDHETQSRFKLGEAHRKVACSACHPLVSLSNGVRLVQYKPIKSQCSDCHGVGEVEDR